MLEFNVMDDSDGDSDLDHQLSNPSLAEFAQETVQQVQVSQHTAARERAREAQPLCAESPVMSVRRILSGLFSLCVN